MDYAIEVKRVPAALHNIKGQTQQAVFFVHLASAHGYHIETIGERLNDEELDFLPIEIDGRVKLVRITSIVYVEFSDTPPEVETMFESSASREEVEVTLRTGQSLTGELVFQAPRGKSRVSDVFNSRERRFLVLVHEGRTYYVQRDVIDEVDL